MVILTRPNPCYKHSYSLSHLPRILFKIAMSLLLLFSLRFSYFYFMCMGFCLHVYLHTAEGAPKLEL